MAKRKGFHEIYLGGCWGELLLIWQGCPWGTGFQKFWKNSGWGLTFYCLEVLWVAWVWLAWILGWGPGLAGFPGDMRNFEISCVVVPVAILAIL